MAGTSSLLSIGGLASGIDTNSLLDGLVALEQQSVTKLENKQKACNVSLTSLGTLVGNLNTFKQSGISLSDPDQFDKFTLTSSNEDILTLEGQDGASPGSFAISVFQTAKSEKIMSKVYASQINRLGISGDFSVNVTKDYKKSNSAATDVTISISNTDSLKDIANKINGAANIGISASIVKLADNQYSLVFTTKDTGADGATYTQTTGTVLQDLGILNASGNKGNVAYKVQSAENKAGTVDITDATLFNAIDSASVTINDTITIKGTDHNGNEIKARNFVIGDPATQTISDLLKEIESTFNGMVTASVENGRIMVTDKTDGRSALQVMLTANNEGGGALDFGGLLSVNTAGKNGVLQVGQDAFFNVDGLNMSSDKNSADDAVQGLTINMKKADLTETVTATIDRDIDGVKKNIQGFIDSLNLTLKYINEQTKVSVTVKKTDSTSNSSADTIEAGPLVGDSTVGLLRSQIVSVINRQHTELKGSAFMSLANIGIGSDPYTGEFKIDDARFKAAISQNYENVKQLFVKTGTGQDANFTFGMSTKDTQPGRYKVDVDAKTVSELDKDDNVINTYNATLNGNVMIVSEAGKAKGLGITVPNTGSTIFTFSKGIGLEIADYVKQATDSMSGIITLDTKGIEKQIKDYDKRISEQQAHVDAYSAQLKAQFSAMEQTMSKLKSQSSQMMSALG